MHFFGAPILDFPDMFYRRNLELRPFHINQIAKPFLRSKISCVHFRDLVCRVRCVQFPCPLTFIDSKVFVQICLITYVSHLNLFCQPYGLP